MNKHFARTRTAKLMGSTVIVGSLLAALTGCGSSDDGVPAEAAPETTATASATAVEPETLRTELVRIIDGDTIEVKPMKDGVPTGEPNITVRLLGIDAPEADACGGAAATANLERFALIGSPLDIKYDPKADRTDQYDRTLAYAYQVPMGGDIGYRQVHEGFAAAWYPEGEPEPEKFEEYEKFNKISIDQKKGVYAECDTIGG